MSRKINDILKFLGQLRVSSEIPFKLLGKCYDAELKIHN